jgi:hypothetical protein
VFSDCVACVDTYFINCIWSSILIYPYILPIPSKFNYINSKKNPVIHFKAGLFLFIWGPVHLTFPQRQFISFTNV